MIKKNFKGKLGDGEEEKEEEGKERQCNDSGCKYIKNKSVEDVSFVDFPFSIAKLKQGNKVRVSLYREV